MARLEGKRCLVTGGSGGIGTATCLALARDGARGVAVHYAAAAKKAEAVAAECRALGADAFAVKADVARRADCEAMVRACVERWGGLDSVVAYAGDPWRPADWFDSFLALEDSAFEQPFLIDVLGSVHTCQAAVRVMQRGGGGSIVLAGSSPALTGDEEGIGYLVAKAGVAALARSLARLYGKDGIRVNAMALGSVRTLAMAGLTEEQERRYAQETALRRMATPEDIAGVAAFLCGDQAAFLTGAVVPVDGGLSFH